MQVTRRRFLAGGTALGLALTSPALSLASTPTHAFGGLAFGGSWRVVGGADLDESSLRPRIEAILETVDWHMSPWRPDSAISRFNAHTSTAWQSMPSDVCNVVAESLSVARNSQGAFDPTVGPSVARFGFGRIDGGVGTYRAIDVHNDSIRKASGDLTLDLCGIAKGYALDQVAKLLRQEGVSQALVEIGGEVVAIGEHPDGRPWQIAIERPADSEIHAQRIVTPKHLALATSGHTPNGYIGRVALSHLIDPANHRPATNGLLSVSVLAETAMRADAWATALTVLGPRRGVECAEQLGIAALFLSQEDNELIETMTGSFATHVVA